ncbi:MAG: hypothetical protein M0R74_12480 [Dehalococcoidia bacterium]|nr:hypothetical protein [Dehalococcoidia bacterium]
MTEPHDAAKDLETPAGIDVTGHEGLITNMSARRKEMLDRIKTDPSEIGPKTPEEASTPDDRNTVAYEEELRVRRAMEEREDQA